MIVRLIVFLVVVCEIVFSLNRNDPCVTPNNEAAKCIPARSCTVILNRILANDENAIQFAQESACGYDDKPLVCCGSSANFITSTIPNIESKDLPDKTVCGLETETVRIIGGQAANLGEFPWMVALEFQSRITGKKSIQCGGSLINKKYVLTAAHCILHQELEVTSAWLGEYDTTQDPDCITYIATEHCADQVKKLKITRKIPHPYFTSKNNNNDIALLRLEKEVEYTDYIRPICLPPSSLPDPPVNTSMTVAGWGLTSANGPSSDVKLKVDVPLLANSYCKQKYPRLTITPNQLCAGGEEAKDSCRGDSGGPLMRPYQDNTQVQWYLEGVVGYGVGCGRPGYPAIYSRVARYISWIVNNIGED